MTVSDITSAFGGFFPALAIDVVAIATVAYGIYYRRHRRRDLLLAFVCFNVGLFAVVRAFMLADANMGTGLALGIGLFGALSIIRLRSEEISYFEVAYFFSALALAIVNGVGGERYGFALAASTVVVATFAVMEGFRPRHPVRRVSLLLDQVFADEGALRAEVERRLGGTVVAMEVRELDFVREITRLDAQVVAIPKVVPAGVAEREPVLAPRSETVGVER